MKILHKAIQKLYLFSCPVCGSKLEAFPSELIDIGNKVSKFWCPECNEDRYKRKQYMSILICAKIPNAPMKGVDIYDNIKRNYSYN